MMPHQAKAEAAMPSAIQNSHRSAIGPRAEAMGEPRTTIAVSARPTVPANRGV